MLIVAKNAFQVFLCIESKYNLKTILSKCTSKCHKQRISFWFQINILSIHELYMKYISWPMNVFFDAMKLWCTFGRSILVAFSLFYLECETSLSDIGNQFCKTSRPNILHLGNCTFL